MADNRTGIKFLNQGKTAQFFSVITAPRERALFAVIYHYGLRVSEAALLQLEEVDLARRRIILHRVKKGLGGERPLFDNTAQVIQTYLQVRLQVGSALFTGRQGNLKRQPIEGLEDCAKLPALTEGLLRRGYAETDVRKILGENVLRVMAETIGQ